MKIYKITVNLGPFQRLEVIEVRASRAAVAVHRALDRFKESELDGATARIDCYRMVVWQYGVFHEKDLVSGWHKTREDARQHMALIQSEHPDWSLRTRATDRNQ